MWAVRSPADSPREAQFLREVGRAGRGDAYWVDFPPAGDVEQTGRRAAMVVRNDRGNDHSACTVVAAIGSASPPNAYPLTVRLAGGKRALPRACHVHCAQPLPIDQGRWLDRVGTLGLERMLEVAAVSAGLSHGAARPEAGMPISPPPPCCRGG